jgi:hypothetical protein
LAERGLSILRTTSNPELTALINNHPLAIHTSFNSDSKFDALDRGNGAEWALSVRVLSSYYGIDFFTLGKLMNNVNVLFVDVVDFVSSHHRQLHNICPDECLLLYLAVDDVGQVLPAEKTDRSQFYRSFLKNITNIMGALLIRDAPNIFVVTMLTGTIYEDIVDVLKSSSHPYKNLGVPLLSFDNMITI